MTGPRTRRNGAVGLSAALVTALALAGCSKPAANQTLPSASPSGSPSSSPSPTPGATGPVAPLTGMTTTAAMAARPAIAVIVGVAGGSSPYGLSTADVVYAEYAEGGLVRLVAVFQSRDSARVGPVTSTRPTDPKLLTVLHGCAAFSGGTSGFVKQLSGAGVCELSAPGSAATPSLFAAAPHGLRPPPGVVPFAGPGQPLAAGRKVAHRLVVTMPGRATQTWTYDAAAALWRSAVGGTPVAAATVEVLVMPYNAIVVHHPLATIQSAAVLGSGPATVVSGGFGVQGSWYRPSAKTLANVVDGSKKVVYPNHGAIWTVLAPSGSTATVT
ncbi:MAG: hypothetical protein DLM59_06145 [Pseudonocardiales bacterium]|nr:MAG: hypothetical protein DLM59_06145 [Pseudonocardiales bacterium]